MNLTRVIGVLLMGGTLLISCNSKPKKENQVAKDSTDQDKVNILWVFGEDISLGCPLTEIVRLLRQT